MDHKRRHCGVDRHWFVLDRGSEKIVVIEIGDRVRIYLDSKFGDKEGWYEGVVIKMDPYSEHRSFYWVELNADAQVSLSTGQISVFNLKNIQKL
jgi:hypothetical protein